MRTFKSEHIIKPRGYAKLDLPEVPIDLEIGCGVGLHPIRYATQNPNRYLIAIEKTWAKFEKFDGRVSRHPDIKNLLAVHADAVAWVTHFLTPNSISKCFILYPNPNPKNPAKRWVRMPFMQKLLEVLKPEGEIIFRTNEKFYHDEVLDFAKSHWGLHLLVDRVISNEERPYTHFEKKYLERGDVCFEAVFQRVSSNGRT